MLLPFYRRDTLPLMGWFGKLPAVGDFAGRGLPHSLESTLYAWFAEGMRTLVCGDPEAWRDAYMVSPIWHFAVNEGVWGAHPFIGCLAPSVDRVGRRSPLIALRSVDRRDMSSALPPKSGWLYTVDAGLRRAISDSLAVETVMATLETAKRAEDARVHEGASAANILCELGIMQEPTVNRSRFSWPDLPERFHERTHRSFWWAEPSPKQPPRQIIHSGPPDAELFSLLMGGWVRT